MRRIVHIIFAAMLLANTVVFADEIGQLEGKKSEYDTAAENARLIVDAIQAKIDSISDLKRTLDEEANLAVADLYAGSGALGFEALSRGAKSVVFVDNSREACNIIKSNQASLKLSLLTIQKSSVQTFLTQKHSFDLIFCDPPYDDFHPEDFSRLSEFLRPAGTLVLSHPALFTPKIPRFSLIKTHSYASANISILQKP